MTIYGNTTGTTIKPDRVAERITAAQVGAAPAGYGLGAASVGADKVNGLNSCKKNGWYWTGDETPNVPSDLAFAAVAVNTRLNNQIVQTLTGINSRFGCQMIRISTDDGATWIEEWVNPPLYVGKEYRTTERFGGKPVYAMRPNIGEGSSISKAVPFAENVDCLVRVEGYWNSTDGSMKVPFTTAYFVDSVYVDKDGDDYRLRVDFNTDTAIYNGYPVIYYTKTT